MGASAKRECEEIERELSELLDRGTVAEVADFSTTRLNWALEKIRALADEADRRAAA